MTYYIKFEDGSEHELPVWLNRKNIFYFMVDIVLKGAIMFVKGR